MRWDELAAEANRPGDLLERLARIEIREQTFPLEAPGLRIELRCDCASRSTSSGTPPRRARAAPKLSTVVVLPTPPF